jgi:Arc/MetJ-type ribon-helix-helix transcriptional regulator
MAGSGMISVRMPRRLLEQIRQQALEGDRTASQEVRRLLRLALAGDSESAGSPEGMRSDGR